MKTKEELNALKEEIDTLNKKLHELTEEELKQVSGGVLPVRNKRDVELPDRKPPVSVYEPPVLEPTGPQQSQLRS